MFVRAVTMHHWNTFFKFYKAIVKNQILMIAKTLKMKVKFFRVKKTFKKQFLLHFQLIAYGFKGLNNGFLTLIVEF